MRTREKGYSFYGITKERLSEIKDYCKTTDQTAQRLIVLSAYEAKPVYGTAIAYSLLNNFASYVRVGQKINIDMLERDFYAYRRKAVAILNEKLKIMGSGNDHNKTIK